MDTIKLVNLTLCSILLITSIIGNTLVLLIFGRQSPLSRVKVLIISLAVNDLLGSSAAFAKSVYDYYYSSPDSIGLVLAGNGDIFGYLQCYFIFSSCTLHTAVIVDRHNSMKTLRTYNAQDGKQAIKFVGLLSMTSFVFVSVTLFLHAKVAKTPLPRSAIVALIFAVILVFIFIILAKSWKQATLIHRRVRPTQDEAKEPCQQSTTKNVVCSRTINKQGPSLSTCQVPVASTNSNQLQGSKFHQLKNQNLQKLTILQ